MKNPAELPRERLVEIVVGLQRILYGRQRPDGSWSCDAEKQWSGADVCQAVADLLEQFDLTPGGDLSYSSPSELENSP